LPRTSDADLEIVRRAYARQVLAASGLVCERIADAFAAIRREDFLGPGPWPILRWGKGYVLTPGDDPVYLYADVLVGIDPGRDLNNGQPSFHFLLLAHLDPQPGHHVVHIGAGTGYYSAILAQLVGPGGRVTAIEYDAGLAARADANLKGLPWVSVVHGDGGIAPFDPADAIYVNAGATHPLAHWLDRLRDGAGLILPLTAHQTRSAFNPATVRRRGAVFLVRRRGDRYAARWISPVAIYPCEGARDQAAATALASALKQGGVESVRSLRRGDRPRSERDWLRGDGWALSYDDA
jgi:protein-L-isoaspartate(D-aspartate) O-methyltransferase